MSIPSFQTVRLSSGSHSSPEEGVCVMELASMLAGERFSDHPRAACPVIGMVLRAYNDSVDDERRQSLYACASAAVGTRARRAVRNARLAACEQFFGSTERSRGAFFHSRLRQLGLAVSAYGREAGEREHAAFLAFVNDLIGARPAADAAVPERGAALRRA